MEKLLLVDGSNLLFQMFFGMPNKFCNENGIGIWGVIGFVGALNKLINMVERAGLEPQSAITQGEVN